MWRACKIVFIESLKCDPGIVKTIGIKCFNILKCNKFKILIITKVIKEMNSKKDTIH